MRSVVIVCRALFAGCLPLRVHCMLKSSDMETAHALQMPFIRTKFSELSGLIGKHLTAFVVYLKCSFRVFGNLAFVYFD